MLNNFPFLELFDWYEKNGRASLPWRNYSFDEKQLGYRVWLAETMLQQTQVERVKVYFENIIHAFPAIEDLAACSYENFFPYYKGLGYYSRARNMLKAAQKVVSDFGGIFPKDTASLRTLPGVGPYTAEAIRAFAYDISTLSFDTNLEKIFSRYYFGNKFQKLSREEKEKILEDFKNSHLSARAINNALMDYGATISLNNISGIDWEIYPFPTSKFYQTRGSLEPIQEKKKSSFPTKQAYVICILHENHKRYLSATQQDTSPNSLLAGEEKPQIAASSLPCEGRVGERYHAEQETTGFSPFYIGKNTGNPRAMIQAYFLKKYNLELSVRPPEIQSYNRFETPYLVCYAQIQSGEHYFQVFENLKVRGYEEGFVEEMEFGDKGENERLKKRDYFEVKTKQNLSLF